MKLFRPLLAAPLAALYATTALAHPASEAGGLPLALHGHAHAEGPGLLLTVLAVVAVVGTGWLSARSRRSARRRK